MGNVTTIKTRRQAVNKGSQLSNSVLNCVATELVQVYSDQNTKAILWTQNNDGIQSIIRLALDTQIGKLSAEDLDIDQLLATKTEIDSYFGSSAGTQASFTFDNSEQSAQVIIKTIADALNCQAYRQFSTIKLKFEKPNVPRMLFTFRSKAPESDTIQRKSLTKEYPTGVEIKWLDTSGQQKSIKVPDDSQQNYKNIELHCIDNQAQAKWRAWREYYKLTYGLITYNSELSPESKLLLINDVIQSSDDTRIYPSAGYIISISDSTLTLSQDVSFESGKDYTIILKDRDGTIESFGATGTGTTDTVIIDATPTIEIYTGINETKTEFYFCEDTEANAQTWLIQSVSFSEKYNKVSAINYNQIYYSKDGT